jgi:hypothetical protein
MHRLRPERDPHVGGAGVGLMAATGSARFQACHLRARGPRLGEVLTRVAGFQRVLGTCLSQRRQAHRVSGAVAGGAPVGVACWLALRRRSGTRTSAQRPATRREGAPWLGEPRSGPEAAADRHSRSSGVWAAGGDLTPRPQRQRGVPRRGPSPPRKPRATRPRRARVPPPGRGMGGPGAARASGPTVHPPGW